MAAKTSKKEPVDKKLWPFFILQVLRNHASDGANKDDDGVHYLTIGQIVDYLRDDYGIETQRRAVADNLTRLYEATFDDPELGFTLEYLEGDRNAPGQGSGKGERQMLRKGWRVVDVSKFDSSEVRMLIDVAVASSVIPPKQIEKLVRKLNDLVGGEVVVPNIQREGHLPALNREFFWNVEAIHTAIREKKTVSFKLGLFGKDNKLHLTRRGRQGRTHRVVPMQLLISKGHYYLLGHYEDSDEVYKYRVDLMQEMRIDDDSHVDEDESNINVVKFREQHSYMMSGKVMKVVLRIDKDRLHTLFDQFGPNVRFKNEKEDTVDAVLDSALYSVLFWALQYYRSVEVISPPELRQVLADAGATIHEMYAGEPGAVSLAERQSKDELING